MTRWDDSECWTSPIFLVNPSKIFLIFCLCTACVIVLINSVEKWICLHSKIKFPGSWGVGACAPLQSHIGFTRARVHGPRLHSFSTGPCPRTQTTVYSATASAPCGSLQSSGWSLAHFASPCMTVVGQIHNRCVRASLCSDEH